MNYHYLLRRVLGRATCKIGKNVQLQSDARIKNARRDSHCIRIGDHSLIAGELFVFAHGGDISIGEWCFIGEGSRIWSSCSISIGNRVLISHNVNVFDSLTHPINAKRRHNQFVSIKTSGHPREIHLGEKPVSIGNDAWIGANAIILRGVTIGASAVVGAGAVVTEDVAPFTVVAGNPARLIRELDADER